jgi:hypothetical protein
MQNSKQAFSLFGTGFVMGFISASILILVFGVKPNAFSVGPLQFEIPLGKNAGDSQIQLQVKPFQQATQQPQVNPVQQVTQQPSTNLNCDIGISGIRGKILDAKDNTPVVGAFVSTDPGSGTALTDQQGNYLICPVAPYLSYIITVTKNGYNPKLYL